MATGSSSQPLTEGDTPSTIRLHILCQSLPPPSRFTLENVPLSSTISQLKSRIEQSFPNNPRASKQRLIYRGKVLAADDATLRAIVSSVGQGTDSMHLVLPPESTHAEPPTVSNMAQDSPFRNSGRASTSSSTWFSPSSADTSVAGASTSSYSGIPRTVDATPTAPHVTVNQYYDTSYLNRHSTTTTTPEDNGEDRHIRTLRAQTVEIEEQLDRRIMPSMENIIRTRNRLLEIQDRRSGRQLPLPGVAELVARILDAQQRARLMEYVQQQHSQTNVSAHNPGSQGNISQTPEPGSMQLFILTSPAGTQTGLVQGHFVSRPTTQRVGSPNTAPVNEPGASQAPQAPQLLQAHQAHQEPQVPQAPNQNAAAVQNALRQVMHNQQRRGNNIEHAGLARHIRRIWLFTRLWLFCYLTSAPGTWRRYIFVSIALIVTFFSETDIPRRFATMVISPIQRHLEGLTHAGGAADRATQTETNGAAAEFNIWDQIRRVERAIVFLFASLVPGIGEGHVQARAAADQAFLAEQERQARERQEQEQEQARERERQEQEQSQAGMAEGAGNASTEQEEVSAAHAQAPVGN
ncbi:uncharacterized protein N7479_000248 [Penicillium vulpinum]|uniref:Ubiquitin-like domain-containing protein n=1 Tax=Penicillium vulpinum TaxID=29845 RepID=A0A1V6RNC9_9EURO|nr:uncharacterized protein N7479_000248 [Penicillium vulpinum]KAJ5970330.1 hypothetical protein N7479_000248 [Penicillium vulpinum]OQE03058.1 hypothetical protein PENVUL_c035G04694 [Penicillium vulpinum]